MATDASSMPRSASDALDHPTSPCAVDAPSRASISCTRTPSDAIVAWARTTAVFSDS